MQNQTKFLARAGMIAALYVVLTLVSALFGLSSGVVQLRLSEVLCILPVLTPAAIPGVTIGCLVANLLCGGTVYDLLLGTTATLLGAIGAYLLRKCPLAASVPTIVSNATLIPVVLILMGTRSWALYGTFAGTVAIGEILSCGVLGTLLLIYLRKRPAVRAMLVGKGRQ